MSLENAVQRFLDLVDGSGHSTEQRDFAIEAMREALAGDPEESDAE